MQPGAWDRLPGTVFDRYPDYEHVFAATQLAFAMLGMGATLTFEDFSRVAQRPASIGAGLFVQLVAVPLVAAAVGLLLRLEAGLAVGLILVAAVPGGTISNVAVFLGRGNTPLSITLTALSTLGCLVTAPLILRLFSAAHLPPGFEMPVARLLTEIALFLLLPLAAGMAVGRGLPDHKGRFTRICIAISLLVLLGMVVGGAGSGRIDAGAYGGRAVVAIFAVALAFQRVAIWSGRLAGLPDQDRLTVAIEATIRNTNLALLVKASMFPAVAGVEDPVGDQVFFVALLYGGAALPVAIPPLVRNARRARPAPAAAGAA